MRKTNVRRTISMMVSVALFTSLFIMWLAVTRAQEGGGASLVPVGQSKNSAGAQCSNASMKGRYGYTYSGTVAGFGAISATGPIKFDGAGNVSAKYTVSLNGVPFQGSFTGTYAVNQDCTASITIHLPVLGLDSHGTYVIVDNGQEAFFMGTDPGINVTGVAKKQ